MRFVGLALIFLSFPLFVGLLKAYPERRIWACFAIGIMPFTMGWLNLDAALVNWAQWPGHTKGMIITILDALVLAIIVTSASPFKKLPFIFVFVAYLLATAVSIIFSNQPITSSFYTFQILRMMLLFVAVAIVIRDPKAIYWLAYGLAAGAIFQGIITIEQRMSGAIQAAGTMGHQNLLGFMLHFVTFPLLALLLAGKQSKLIILGVLFALIAVALGASRGSVGFAGIGLVLLLGLSMVRRVTAQKWKILGLGILAFTLVAPLTISTLGQRFGDAPIDTGPDGERVAFERAAKAMWTDHPMGVGANQYVVIANSEGYSARAGVVWNFGSRATHVHNMYLLAAAETGWLGLITLVSLFVWAITSGLIFALGNRRDPRGDVVLGASVAILVAALHSLYEWIFVSYQVQYVFAISLGIIAGTMRQVGREKKYRARLRYETSLQNLKAEKG